MALESRGLKFAFRALCIWLCIAVIDSVALFFRLTVIINPHESFSGTLFGLWLLDNCWSVLVVALATRLAFVVTSVKRMRDKLGEVAALVFAMGSLILIPIMLFLYPPKG